VPRASKQPASFPAGFPPKAATWAEALVGYRFLCDARGNLVARDVQAAERQLRKEARALRSLAVQVADHTLDAIKHRLGGLGTDSLVRGALIPATGFVKHDTFGPESFRRLAQVLVGAADYLRDGMALYRAWIEQEHGVKLTGRDPNMALDWLLKTTRRLKVTDAEVARRLEQAGLVPKGLGTDTPAARWTAVIREARRRRRTGANETRKRSAAR
jgi:hypothetical protein